MVIRPPRTELQDCERRLRIAADRIAELEADKAKQRSMAYEDAAHLAFLMNADPFVVAAIRARKSK